MQSDFTTVGGVSNPLSIPADGIVSIVLPPGIDVCAYLNNKEAPMHHIHVKAGDSVYFTLTSPTTIPPAIEVQYNGAAHSLVVKPDPTVGITAMTDTTLVAPVASITDAKIKKLKKKVKELEMTPAETINLFANPNQGTGTGGAMGAGLGAGLLGGVLGGALLGGNNGGLFGGRNGNGDAALLNANINTDNAIAASERLNMARFDAEAQREIQAAVERTASATQLAFAVGNAALGVEVAKGQGEINTQVALTTGNLGTQGALNAAALGVQVQKTAGDTQTQIATQTAALGVQSEKTAAANALAVAMAIQSSLLNQNQNFAQSQLTAMQNANTAATQLAATQYTLATAIKADGDLTRGILIANNDAELNRRLITAQNEIIELRGDSRSRDRSREVEVNVSQSVNQNQAQFQAQQQQQQQATFNAHLLAQLQNLQIATATNQSLIIGNTGAVVGGPQTANPVNVRA